MIRKISQHISINWRGYLCAAGATALATWLKYLAQPDIIPANVPILYLAAIVPTAIFFGFGPSILVCLLSLLAFDYFFIPPLYHFDILNATIAPILAIFLLVGVLFSYLASNLRRKNRLAAQEISVRKQTEIELREYKDRLEDLVKKRTNELEKSNTDLKSEIAERIKAEDTLRQREERFRVLIQNLQSGVALIDENGRFATINKSFLKMFGLADNSDILNVNSQDWSAWQVFAEDGKTLLPVDEHPVRKAALTGQAVRNQLVGLKLPDSEELHWILINAEPILKSTGKIQYLIATYYDITERIKAEEGLRVYAKELETANRELEAFSYSVSHDLRAPLRTLDGFSEAVLAEYGDRLDETGKDYLYRVRKASQTMGQLIDDILKLSRISRAEVHQSRVNLSNIAKSITDELKSSQPNRLAEIIIAPDLMVTGDKNLLEIGIRNLLENAWKYTSKRPSTKIELGSIYQNGDRTYFIKDNGIGFDMRYKDKLFQPFQRLHTNNEYPGTGIGLATVQRVIRRHNGQIWAESEVGKGATFYFTLK